jgi:hypothetical protein
LPDQETKRSLILSLCGICENYNFARIYVN